MAKINNIRHLPKIKGWKKNLSKQAIKEWYLKNKNSSSFKWFENEEEIRKSLHPGTVGDAFAGLKKEVKDYYEGH